MLMIERQRVIKYNKLVSERATLSVALRNMRSYT